MRTDATFVTVPYSKLSDINALPLKNTGGINVLIDSPGFDVAVISKYINSFHCTFVYSLSDAIIDNNNFANTLPRLYTLHTLCDSFMKSRDIIPVFSGNRTSINSHLTSLKDYFGQQGDSNIDFAIFEQQNNSIQLQNTILFLPAEKVESFNKTDLDTYIDQEINQVLITSNATTQSNEWLDILFHTAALTREAGWGLHKSALWQERSKLYLSFIALSKKVGETEYYDLRQWYHNEYEVLPLWFKRLGHIIKVLMGKRSFRSLFDENAKKHK
jgi:hypothetical protein